MDHLVDNLFVFEGNGKIRLFNGNYTFYRNSLAEAEPEPEKKKKVDPAPEVVPTQPMAKKKGNAKDKQEYAALEKEIQELEKSKAGWIEKLNAGGNHEELLQWSQEIKRLSDQIDAKSMRWLELGEVL
jgi:ATP-binding cassette subfamily F protein uup